MDDGMLGEQDLAVSGMRDAVVRQRSEGAHGVAGAGVEDTFESMREEAVRTAGAGGDAAGGVFQRLRRFLLSHPRAVLLFVACAAIFAALARAAGGVGALEAAAGAAAAGAVGVVLDRRVFGGGRAS